MLPWNKFGRGATGIIMTMFAKKDFRNTLKHQKEELNLVELGSHLRIEESLKVQDNDKPKGKNVSGPSVNNMMERNNSFRFYGIEPNESILINSMIESIDDIFNENIFSLVPRPSLKIPNRTEDFGGSVVPEEMNVKTAFLNGELDKEVYIKQPQGFIMPGNENKVDLTKEFWSSRFFMKDMEEADVIVVFCNPFSSTSMGDKNPIRTLGDYSKPSHEGYMNTIVLPVGNNVVPILSDTIRLVQNECSFDEHWSEDPNQHLKDFLKLLDSHDLDDANRKDFRNTLKHQKEELNLVELGSHLRIEESLKVQDNDKPKGKNVSGPSVNNMMERNNSFRFYGIEPNESILINSMIESIDDIFNENRFSLVPRPSLKIPNRNEDFGGSVVPEEMNVKTAFLNGELDKEVYIKQPQGFIMPGNENKVDLTKEFWSSRFFMKDMEEADVIVVLEVTLMQAGLAILKIVRLLVARSLAAASKETEWLRNLILEIPLWSKPKAPISIRCDSAATLAKAYIQLYNGKSRHLGVTHRMIRVLIMNEVVSIEFVRNYTTLGRIVENLVQLWESGLICTDIAKITRKSQKSDKNGHENGKSTQEPGFIKKSQQKSTNVNI
nr:zinc finger, CCHC-type [Tanacetum cinerariifolium]